jgi:hypothetical protein
MPLLFLLLFCCASSLLAQDPSIQYERALRQAQAQNPCTRPVADFQADFRRLSPWAELPAQQWTDSLEAQALRRYQQVKPRLTAIDPSNTALRDTLIDQERYVLMQAWKSTSFQRFIETPKEGLAHHTSSKPLFAYALFLTPHLDLERRVKGLANLPEEQAKTRLRQLIGLPPDAGNDLVVSFWVREGDLLRPCPDSSTNLRNPLPSTASYREQYRKFAQDSYANPKLYGRYPFTGLGYTWDYAPDSDGFGITEFVLKEGRKVYIRRVQTTQEYLKEHP